MFNLCSNEQNYSSQCSIYVQNEHYYRHFVHKMNIVSKIIIKITPNKHYEQKITLDKHYEQNIIG